MADRKITDLTELTAPAADDLLPIVDSSEATAANKNKKIQYGTFLRNLPSGTVGAPSLAWTADTGVTGIYRSAANELAFTTNSTLAGKFTTTGFQLGTGTAAAQLHLFSSDTTDQVIIENTDAGLDTAPDVVLYRNSASPADNDNLGNIEFRGKDSGGNDHAYAQILSTIGTVTDTAEVGILDLMTANASAPAMRLRLRGENVGISEATPLFPLHVSSTITGTALQVQSTNNDSASGGDITLYRRRGAATVGQNGDLLSTVFFRGHNDNATTEQVDYAAVEGSIVSVTNNSEDGQLSFKVQKSGTLTTQLAITNANAILSVRPILPTHTPASPTATGVTGEIAWDNGYFYVCTGTNTWKKVGISTDGIPGSTTTFSSGSAASPSITFADDTNTGIFNPAADAVGITTGGTERFRVNSSGQVGIGTGSPATLLHLSSATGSATPTPTELRIATTTNASDWSATDPWGRLSFYSPDTSAGGAKVHAAIDTVCTGTSGGASFLSFKTYNTTLSALTEVMRFDSSSRVGIGNNAPSEALDVSGVIRRTNTGSAGYYFRGYRSSTTSAFYIYDDGTDIQLTNEQSGALQFRTANAERARIDSSGRLLVGASTSLNSASSLQVRNDSGLGIEVFRSADSTGASRVWLTKSRGTSSSPTIVVNGDNLSEIVTSGHDGVGYRQAASIAVAVDGTPGTNDMPGRIVLSTTLDGAITPTERLRIDNAGTTTLTSAAATAPFIAKISTSEVARIDSSGRLLVGTSSAVSAFATTFHVQLLGTSLATSGQLAVGFANDATSSGSLVLGKSRNTTKAAGAIVSNGDRLGFIGFVGDDGTALIRGAQILAEVDGTPGSNDMPGRIVLSTTLDGASSPTEALRITNDRVIAYNQGAPAAVNATATLTVANLKTGIITSTSAAATDMTLPTGTDTEAGFNGIYTNMTFEWSVINTGPSLVTVLAATAHTLVGSGAVATGTSGRFASRRTAANTFVTYRLS